MVKEGPSEGWHSDAIQMTEWLGQAQNREEMCRQRELGCLVLLECGDMGTVMEGRSVGARISS